MKQVTKTSNEKSATVARILAAIPLLVIGTQHLIGLAPLEPILQGAGIPFPHFNALLGPVVQLLAGSFLISGYFARLGALLAIGAMSLASYTHLIFDWDSEPPIALPIIILVLSGYVLWKGAGAFSFDLRCQKCART